MPAEAFPYNAIKSGQSVNLGEHYQATLKEMNIDPATLPDGLFFTYCGDLLGASGEHYQKGNPISFAEACAKSSLNFSDDFMESLAMHLMRDLKIDPTPAGLMAARDHFHDLIAEHFNRMSLTYSPWFGALFNAATMGDYMDILLAHSSCGAAMRAAVMASDNLSNDQALPLFLLSHANVEAVEGAYLVLGIARAFIGGRDFDAALEEGFEAAKFGRQAVRSFQLKNGRPVQDFAPIRHALDAVFLRDDPYRSIADIEEEGIETRFVVPAALYLVRNACGFGGTPEGVRSGVEEIVTGSLRIGGDPDTICSIAMGLYGLRYPQLASQALAALRIGRD